MRNNQLLFGFLNKKNIRFFWFFAQFALTLQPISKVNPLSRFRVSLERTNKKTVVSTKRPALG